MALIESSTMVRILYSTLVSTPPRLYPEKVTVCPTLNDVNDPSSTIALPDCCVSVTGILVASPSTKIAILSLAVNESLIKILVR